MNRKTPFLTVDIVIFLDGDKIVLIKRANPPFEGLYALPGGFVEYGEKVEDAAVREAKEETGLAVKLQDIIGIYSELGRDPRGHVASIVYLAEVVGGHLNASTDAEEAIKFRFDEIPENLAFDHKDILEDALKLWRKNKKN